MRPAARWLARFLAFGLLVGAAAAEELSGTLIHKASGVPLARGIEGLLVNMGEGHVAAASLAGTDGNAMSVAQDTKDFTLLLKGLDKDFQTYGFSITPARTRSPWPRISLHDYATGGLLPRLLGSLTLGYAQGRSEEAGRDWERRAFSLETGAFWNEDEDPVVAMAKGCGRAALSTPEDEADRPSGGLAAAAAEAAASAAAAPGAPGAPGAPAAAAAPSARVPALPATPVEAADRERAVAAFNRCVEPELARLGRKWNRTRFSVSYGTGWVRPADRSFGQQRLGHTLALALVYGFDGVRTAALRDRAALTVILRHSRGEPVIDTLASGSPQRRNSTLAAVRLSGGSEGLRALVEFSNARKRDITTTQRTFVHALGIDYALSGVTVGDLWLGLRYGRQRKVTGDGTEASTLLTLSYSGKPSLGR